ncbi:MAG TPA: type IV toxin-antitoxin system AbiEi family antitoxin domain-containing protein [Solirubrobacterales bacterium]|nr:type IV toxin-antitoxin system AbiEi family antitoxin domain-containing protein [Solirubrobacterales bacterium]
MRALSSESRSKAAWALARHQHGVLTHGDLVGLGFSPKAIKHRVRTGRLHPMARGVYAVGRPHLTRHGRWMGAVLACGPDAALSHRSAAALWGFGTEHRDHIDVSVRRPSEARIPGVRCHRRPNLPAGAITTRLGIPLTQPVQTLLDLTRVCGPKALERAINEADKHDVIDPDALRKALGAHAGEPGVRPLRRILDRHTFRLSDDELERLFRPLAAEAGLPVPLTKVEVDEFEVDFFWPELGLVVETDGWRYHRTPATQTRDALRFQEHTAAGRTPLRFSHWQVKHEPGHVLSVLRRTAARLRARPAPSHGR